MAEADNTPVESDNTRESEILSRRGKVLKEIGLKHFQDMYEIGNMDHFNSLFVKYDTIVERGFFLDIREIDDFVKTMNGGRYGGTIDTILTVMEDLEFRADLIDTCILKTVQTMHDLGNAHDLKILINEASFNPLKRYVLRLLKAENPVLWESIRTAQLAKSILG